MPEPLRDHRKGHVGGDVTFDRATFSGSTITFTKATFSRGDVDFGRPRHWNPGPTVDWADTVPDGAAPTEWPPTAAWLR